MATKEELIQRWDIFLTKMETRFSESLEHAESACLEQLTETDYDYYTILRTWMGIKSQIGNLKQKIYETWHHTVEPQMKALGEHWYYDENLKQIHLNDTLTERLGSFEIELQGKLAKQFYDHAIQVTNHDFNCSQCGAKIEIVKDLFRAQYVTCHYCQTVNTFEPETKFMQINWNVIDDMVRFELLPLEKEMNNALEEIKALRKPITNKSLEEKLWQNYKNKYTNYHTTFFKRCIEFSSDRKKRFEDDLNRKEIEFNEYEAIERYNKYSN